MKTICSLLFLVVINFYTIAQVVEIPDDNFVSWLTLNFPDCMNGNMMDTQCEGITQATDIICRNEGIADLDGLQYFVSMESLQAQQNNLTSFPPLPIPNNISSIDVRLNDIQSIDYIPESVYVLKLSSNPNLSSLPSSFPSGIQYLYMDNCTSLTNIPPLPLINMNTFSRNDNPQLPLQPLPLTLTSYSISNCGLTEIPELPIYLNNLDISDNDLGNQDSFFTDLNFISSVNVSNTNMSILPNLPETLTFLQAGSNQLTQLPELPENLQVLWVNSNPLTNLVLNSSIQTVWAFDCEIESVSPTYLPSCTEFVLSSNNLTEAVQTAENMVF